jgi:hypothetical protein
MYPDVSAASLDEPLEIILLLLIQYVTCCGKKDDRLVSLEIFFIEPVGIFRGVYQEMMLLAKLF